MVDTATTCRTEERAAPTFAGRAVVAATSAAALAIGLSTSPLGFFSAPIDVAGAGLDLTDPWRLAIPALFLAMIATSALVRRDPRVAWAVTGAGAIATAATTEGARRWYGGTRWTSPLTDDPSSHRLAVVAALAMGVTVGGLILATRSTARPVPLLVAYGIGLVGRTGGGWYQPRYDLAAALLTAVAFALVTWSGERGVPVPRTGRAIASWAGPVGLAVALAAVEYTYSVELSAVYGWSDANVSTPLFVTAGRVYAVLAGLCAVLVAYLAVLGRRAGLAARSVLVATAVATALGAAGGGDGWLPSHLTLAVAALAVAATALTPVTWRKIPALACVELAGVVGLLGGLIRVLGTPGADSPSYAVLIGSLVVVVAELRAARTAGAAPVAGLGLLVFSVTPVARLLAGGLLRRAAPHVEIPAAFDRLVWVVLVGAVLPALVAITYTASRVSDSAD